MSNIHRSPGSDDANRISLLLCDLESPINIGQILRTADVFGLRVYVADGRGVLGDPTLRRVVEDFSCGALARTTPVALGLDEVRRLLASRRGRNIATSMDAAATSLHRFRFHPNDLIVLGNEYRGVPPDVAELCSKKLVIPMPRGSKPKPDSWAPITQARDVRDNGAPCLNVGAAAAIIAYACFEQSEPSAYGSHAASPRDGLSL